MTTEEIRLKVAIEVFVRRATIDHGGTYDDDAEIAISTANTFVRWWMEIKDD